MAEINQAGWNTLEWSMWAMHAARIKLINTPATHPHDAFAALGETLWWICALDGASGIKSSWLAYDRVWPVTLGFKPTRIANSFAEVVPYVLENQSP